MNRGVVAVLSAAALLLAPWAVAGVEVPPVAQVAPAVTVEPVAPSAPGAPVLTVAPIEAARPSPPIPELRVDPAPQAPLSPEPPVAACPPTPEEPPSAESLVPPEEPQPLPAIFSGDSLTPLLTGSDGFFDPTGAMRTIFVPDRKEVSAIIKEFNSIGRSTMSLSLGRAGKYLPIIREEFQALGLPEELAALPLVESSYNPLAVSTAGAVGLWQFVAATARLNGLRVDWWVDERLDPIASTKAAARHLKDLYDHYGDWDLALAAYNAGSGFVDRAGGKKDGADFWQLCNADRIRSQTRRYVPKFYAALAIMGDPLAHGYDPMDETGALAYDEVPVSNPVSLAVIAQRVGMSYEDLSTLNPGLKRGCTPPGEKPYLMRVPRGLGESIATIIADIPDDERLLFRRHKVQSGETVKKIAKKYGVEADAITLMNGLKDSARLKAGLELVIPVGGQRKSKAVPSGVNAKVADSLAHVVARGDTLSSISRRYGTTVSKLMEINDLDDGYILSIGQRLVVGPSSD